MKKYIIIKADTNDGDYITNQSLITDESIEQLRPIIEIIKSKKGKYETCEMGNPRDTYSVEELSDEQLDLFDNFIPYGEYGIHTIEKVQILTVLEEENLL